MTSPLKNLYRVALHNEIEMKMSGNKIGLIPKRGKSVTNWIITTNAILYYYEVY